MANNLIPEELQALIQQYLTDGVLTDKERAVILRKAEGMGLDRDEVDLYLDAEEQKIDQATDAAVRKQKGKTCPYCGSPVPQLADKCPACGQFITPEASDELKEIIDNLEEALVQFKSGKDLAKSKATVERYARKAKMYFSNNPKIKPLLAEVEEEMAIAEKKVKSEAKKRTTISIITNKWFFFVLIIIIGPVLSHFMISYYEELSHEYGKQASDVQFEFLKTCAVDAGLNIPVIEVGSSGLPFYCSSNDNLLELVKEKYPKEYTECNKKSEELMAKRWQCDDAAEDWETAFVLLCIATVLLGVLFLYIQFKKKE